MDGKLIRVRQKWKNVEVDSRYTVKRRDYKVFGKFKIVGGLSRRKTKVTYSGRVLCFQA